MPEPVRERMRVWRLARACYSAMSGEGARRNGGRWNPVGVPVVYTAHHLSLAVLETLLHTDSDLLPEDLTAFEIDIPVGVSCEFLASLPAGWNATMAPIECQDVGRAWAESGRSLVLAVPSIVVPEETNYLLNPAHPELASVRIVSRRLFTLDPRLFKAG